MRFRIVESTSRFARICRVAPLLVAGLALIQCAKDAPNDPYITRPKAVTDLSVLSTTDSGVILSFTEVDDGLGNVASYDVRVASSSMAWNSAQRVTKGSCATPVLGVTVSAKRQCTVLGLLPSQSYTFQVAAFRGTLAQESAVGPLSNIASATTGAAVASVVMSPTTWSGTLGQTVQFTATLKDAAGNVLTGRTVTWSSSDNNVISIAANGLATNTGVGTATVTATAEGQSAQAQVTVTSAANAPAAVTTLAVAAATDSSVVLSFTEVDDGTGQPAHYDVRFATSPLSWASAASVTRGTCSTPLSGSVIGSQRTCTVLGLLASTNYNFQIVAFRGTLNTSNAVFGPLSNVAAATTLASTKPVATVSVSPASATRNVGQTIQLAVTLTDASGNVLTGRTVTWSSSDTTAATVSSGGLVSAIRAGSATITALSEGKSGVFQITVTSTTQVPVATVSVAPASTSIAVGAVVQLTATTKDASGNTLTGRTITWSSSDSTLATVSSSGSVAAVAVGSVTITATSEGKSGQSQIVVTTPPPPPPPGTDEPVDPGSGYLWTDNFDRYASVLAMESPGGCPAGSDAYGLPSALSVYGRATAHAAASVSVACQTSYNMEGKPTYELITGRGGVGKALRGNVATSPSTSQGGIDWLSPWNGSNSSFQQDPTKAIVIQFWIRMSPGGHVGPVGGKYLLLWVDNLGGPARDRIQFAWTGFNPVVWRPQDGPNTSGFYRTPQPVGPYANPDVNDGQWHRMTQLFKPNSSTTYQHVGGTSPANEIYNGTSSRDGRIAMWVDGHKVMDVSQATVGVTPPGGTNPWCYQSDVDWIPHAAGQYLEFPSVINDSAMSWTIDHDDLKVWQF